MYTHRRFLSREDLIPEAPSEQAKRCFKRVIPQEEAQNTSEEAKLISSQSEPLIIPSLDMNQIPNPNLDPNESEFSFEDVFEDKHSTSNDTLPPNSDSRRSVELPDDPSARKTTPRGTRTFFGNARSPITSPLSSPLTSPRDSNSVTSPVTSPTESKSPLNNKKVLSPPTKRNTPRLEKTHTPRTLLEKAIDTTSGISLPTSWSFYTPKRTVSSFLSTPYKKKRQEIFHYFAELDEAGKTSFSRETLIEEFPMELNDEAILIVLRLFFANTTKDFTETQRILMGKFILQLAYPTELIPGVRAKMVDEGIIPKLLQMGIEGKLRLYHKIEWSEVELGDLIAKGAGGVVYKGKWNNKEVAVKICGRMGIFFGTKTEFRFEVGVMSIVEHPNILTCYGANEKGQDPFIVLPLCEKGTLEAVLYTTKLPLSIKLHLAIQTAEGILHMHRCGLLHRDLKPANILVGKDFEVSLIDFGVSRIQDEKRPMTMNVGTTAWIAPEIFDGDGTYTNAVDVYSYGLILYELVTQCTPFKDYKTFEIPRKVLEGVRPEIPPGSCSDALASLIQQCWHSLPKKRPSLEVVCAQLKEIQEQSLWANPKHSVVQGNFTQLGEFPHPTFINFLIQTADDFIWVGSVDGLIAVYKFQVVEEVPKMMITTHWIIEYPILEIIFVPVSKEVWVFGTTGGISIWSSTGVHVRDLSTCFPITCVTLINYSTTPDLSLSTELRFWCGNYTPEGKNFITVWHAISGEEVCKMNINDPARIRSIVQFQQLVLVATNQKLFGYKLTPKFFASWRVISEDIIQRIHLIDTPNHNLWIRTVDKSYVKVWDCSMTDKQTLLLTDNDMSINHNGMLMWVSQVNYKPQSLVTVWSLVSNRDVNTIVIRNASNLSVLQEITLPDDKSGRSMCLIGDYVLLAVSSADINSGCILCYGFNL